jgi:hydroxymethylglutaryl-CoA synthase
MYSLRVCSDGAPDSALGRLIAGVADVRLRLERRTKVAPPEFARVMKLREDTHHCAPYTPTASTLALFPGTWYLERIDEKHRRQYDRTPLALESNGERVKTSVADGLHVNNAQKSLTASPRYDVPSIPILVMDSQ